jgi:periplasmic divalent cation tolerance protein
MDIRIIVTTLPDAETAQRIGTQLVEERLAACVTLLPGVTSLYPWQGKMETASEVMALFKTTSDLWPSFEQRLKELHPYDVPEILVVKPEAVAESYAQWVRTEVQA